MSRRTERVADLLRAELSTCSCARCTTRASLATVTDVDVTPDLRRAAVKVSVLGERRASATAPSRRCATPRGFLRRELAHRLRLRVDPRARLRARPRGRAQPEDRRALGEPA